MATGVLGDLGQVPINSALKSFLGRGRFQYGPCRLYLCDLGLAPAPVAMTGTVTAVASKTLTGTLTEFLTEIAPGQWIKIDTLTAERVASVTDNFTLDLYTAVTATDDTITRPHLIYLGCTDSTVITANNTKVDLKCSQEGASPADRATSGYECKVEMGFARQNADQLNEVMQGLNNTFDVDGNLVLQTWRPKLNELDSDIAKRLFIVPLDEAGVETTDPMMVLQMHKAAPMVSISATYDAENQVFVPASFNCYTDDGGVVLSSDASL